MLNSCNIVPLKCSVQGLRCLTCSGLNVLQAICLEQSFSQLCISDILPLLS